MPSEAFERFVKSLTMDYEKWHDGVGYDVAAVKEMTKKEQGEVIEMMSSREITWREIEVLELFKTAKAKEALKRASKDHLSVNTRLAAGEALAKKGWSKALEESLCREIRTLSKVSDGLTRALQLAEEHPSEAVKQALLWASWNQTECSMHCAALLCFLAGAAKEPFDWNMRPLFLRLDLHNSYFERKKAFDELCGIVKMELDTSQ